MMSQTSKDELLTALRPRYRRAKHTKKQQILDELMAVTGYHRKCAIQVLNHPSRRKKRKKRTSQTKYQGPVRAALEQIWRTSDCICDKRLIPVLPQYIEALERFGELAVDDATRAQLLTISPATIVRLLKRACERTKPHRNSPGRALETDCQTIQCYNSIAGCLRAKRGTQVPCTPLAGVGAANPPRFQESEIIP